MPLTKDLLKQLSCCLSDDGHIVQEPILIKCGANACKKCVEISSHLSVNYEIHSWDYRTTSMNPSFFCFSCQLEHQKNYLSNTTSNKIVETLIHSFLGDLFIDLKSKQESTTRLLKGFN
jgi:hypothetical protein